MVGGDLNDLLDPGTRGREPIDFAQSAIAGSASVVEVVVGPAAAIMVAEGRATMPFFRRAVDDLPAGDEGLHMPDASDTDLLLGDRMPYAFEPFDVGA